MPRDTRGRIAAVSARLIHPKSRWCGVTAVSGFEMSFGPADDHPYVRYRMVGHAPEMVVDEN